MEITFPEDTESVIDAIRDAIGRYATFYVVASSVACPDCDIDPVTNTSTDSFCTTCEGVYWIPTYSGVDILSHISWGKSDQMRWETGGMWYEGSCGLQIAYSASNLNTVNNTIYVVVDEKTMEIKKTMLRGVKNINRILLDLIEKEK